MGTRGLIAYKYKGTPSVLFSNMDSFMISGYYVIVYNQLDSYPMYLGNRLVANIPQTEEDFQSKLAPQCRVN